MVSSGDFVPDVSGYNDFFYSGFHFWRDRREFILSRSFALQLKKIEEDQSLKLALG